MAEPGAARSASGQGLHRVRWFAAVDQIGNNPADAETVAAHAADACMIDNRQHVRHGVDHGCPALPDFGAADLRESFGKLGESPFKRFPVGFRVEKSALFERRFLIQLPVPCGLPRVWICARRGGSEPRARKFLQQHPQIGEEVPKRRRPDEEVVNIPRVIVYEMPSERSLNSARPPNAPIISRPRDMTRIKQDML